MALLGSFIDVRTIDTLASNGSVSFAHGLPSSPDFVIVQPVGAATVASNAAGNQLVSSDATNVTVYAGGLATPVSRVIAVVAHSVIR